jgi:hypothetical protein
VEPQALAKLVESSESRAYTSLIQAAPKAFLDEHGFFAVPVGSAVAIVAESVTNTLNMNRVIGLGIAEPASIGMVEEIVAIFESRGLPFGIEVGPFAQPSDIPAWLKASRIRRGVSTAMHYRAAGNVDVTDGTLSVVRAPYSARSLVADICCAVFRMPHAAQKLIAGTADVPGWKQWLAYLGDQPVAAALSYISSGVAWFGWDATLPEFRGRGAQLSIIAHRLNDAAADGCEYVTTETATNTSASMDPSYRNYARLGFSLAYERATFVAPRERKKNHR